MNNGLPSLLDAIFGKQNLDTVSLDEIYELISEFPSFNAGHFLLSKKLKEQQESGYEKETMRTALYFNNPFWLDSILNDAGPGVSGIIAPANRSESTDEFLAQDTLITENETPDEILPPENFEPGTKPQLEEEPSEENDITDQQQSAEEALSTEYTDGPVTSFDELISKYQIADLTTTEKSPETTVEESQQGTPEQNTETILLADKTDSHTDKIMVTDGETEELSGDYEIREEVINEYGIFEEVKVKKTDFDLEAFDRPVVNIQDNDIDSNNSTTEESTVVQGSGHEPSPAEPTEMSSDQTDIHTIEEESNAQRTQADYEAFDRPVEQHHPQETDKATDINSEEESISEIYSGHDQGSESAESPQWEPDPQGIEVTTFTGQTAANDPIQDSTIIPGVPQKPFTPFDPKKAESIVFAPYHMIDYFASQGIKLNLEENPADPFSRQLKSFTDWLKVMKKLPAQSIAEKTDDGEVDRIRHFAAHSIDEREILTESMAEVLAKQGMYENAIALFQKLSLIYPPKSAYFASRIEQIKASLP